MAGIEDFQTTIDLISESTNKRRGAHLMYYRSMLIGLGHSLAMCDTCITVLTPDNPTLTTDDIGALYELNELKKNLETSIVHLLNACEFHLKS